MKKIKNIILILCFTFIPMCKVSGKEGILFHCLGKNYADLESDGTLFTDINKDYVRDTLKRTNFIVNVETGEIGNTARIIEKWEVIQKGDTKYDSVLRLPYGDNLNDFIRVRTWGISSGSHQAVFIKLHSDNVISGVCNLVR